MSAAYPAWPVPRAWLYGWVDTDVPGYRTVTADGNAIVVPAGYYMWPDYVAALSAQMNTILGTAEATPYPNGSIYFDFNAYPTIVWDDRMGWLLGLDRDPGDTDADESTTICVRPSPGAIPLIGAQWSRVEITRDVQLLIDRHLRGHGFVWGRADVWRWTLRMSRPARDSLLLGWCLSGQVTVSASTPAEHVAATATAWSTSAPTGYVTGYVLGTERGRWLDDTQTIWDVDLLLAVAP